MCACCHRKPLSRGGLELTNQQKQSRVEKAVDLTLRPGESADSPPPLARHAEGGWPIPEFAARVVVCVQNLKQTKASRSQMWGLSGSLAVPGVRGVKAAHARSCSPPGNVETWRPLEPDGPAVPKPAFLCSEGPHGHSSKTHRNAFKIPATVTA